MTSKECDIIEDCIMELAIDGKNSKFIVADKLIDLVKNYYYKDKRKGERK